MESFKEAMEYYESIENAAAKRGMRSNRFREYLYKEEINGVAIKPPDYFNSYFEAVDWLGTKREAAEFGDLAESTFKWRHKLEERKNTPLQYWLYLHEYAAGEKINPLRDKYGTKFHCSDELEDRYINNNPSNIVTSTRNAREEIVTDYINYTKEETSNTNYTCNKIPMSLHSDIHFSEVVNENCTLDRNKYNMDIAEKRIKTYTEGLKNRLKENDYPGLVICLGGDLCSGIAHPEQVATNEVTFDKAKFNLVEIHEEMILGLLKYVPYIKIYSVPGNHGKLYNSNKSYKEQGENIDVLHAQDLFGRFKYDDRVEVDWTTSSGQTFEVLGNKFLLTHGDKYTVSKEKKTLKDKLASCIEKEKKNRVDNIHYYEKALIGHFHEAVITDEFFANGSVVGMNEYATDRGYSPEVPQQLFWLATDYGIVRTEPILLEEPMKKSKPGEPMIKEVK